VGLYQSIGQIISETSFLFFPSTVWWTAGLHKESILWAAMSVLIVLIFKGLESDFLKKSFWKAFFSWQDKGQTSIIFRWFLFLMAAALLFKLKYYYLAVLLPVLWAYSLVFLFGKRFSLGGQVILWFLVFSLSLFISSHLHTNLSLARFATALLRNHNEIVLVSRVDNLIQYSDLQADALSILKNSPLALFSAFFRPFFWEDGGFFKKIIGFENLLLALSLLACRKFKHKEAILILSALIYSLLLAILLAIASPNLGSLARYKVAYMPFLMSLIVGAWDWDWINKKAARWRLNRT
jgi:hypothetical protein